MAVNPTPRLQLKRYTAGADPHPTRADHNAEQELLDAVVAMAAKGTFALRPAAGIANRFYFTTDTPNRLFYDDGAAWFEVGTNGGGGAGAALVIGGAGAEGSSTRSARADHTHPLPLATSAVPGALSAADKAKLDGATSAGTASRVVMYDAAGRFTVATPAASTDVTNKAYVDMIGTQAAAGVHTHTAAEINSGTLDPARLPAVTTTAQGAMLAADKVKLNGASSLATAGSLMAADAAGRYQAAAPSSGNDVTNKTYVDGQVGTRALTTHNHSWSQITSGVPATFAPSAHSHDAADVATGVLGAARLPGASGTSQGAMSSADKIKLDNATSSSTASRVVMRDASGRSQFADPSAGADAATKTYVDNGLSGKASNSHGHALATSSSDGFMPFAHWSKVQGATNGATPNTMVMRDGNGRFDVVGPPTGPFSVTDKAYVDSGLSGKAASNHGHDLASLSGVNRKNSIEGSDRAWLETVASSSSWATVNVDSNGYFFRFTSSEKYKENIRDLEPTLDKLDQLRGVMYDRVDGPIRDEVGFIAEETEPLFPEVIQYVDGKPDGINYQELVAPIVVGIQELHGKVKSLTERVEELEASL